MSNDEQHWRAYLSTVGANLNTLAGRRRRWEDINLCAKALGLPKALELTGTKLQTYNNWTASFH